MSFRGGVADLSGSPAVCCNVDRYILDLSARAPASRRSSWRCLIFRSSDDACVMTERTSFSHASRITGLKSSCGISICKSCSERVNTEDR